MLGEGDIAERRQSDQFLGTLKMFVEPNTINIFYHCITHISINHAYMYTLFIIFPCFLVVKIKRKQKQIVDTKSEEYTHTHSYEKNKTYTEIKTNNNI